MSHFTSQIRWEDSVVPRLRPLNELVVQPLSSCPNKELGVLHIAPIREGRARRDEHNITRTHFLLEASHPDTKLPLQNLERLMNIEGLLRDRLVTEFLAHDDGRNGKISVRFVGGGARGDDLTQSAVKVFWTVVRCKEVGRRAIPREGIVTRTPNGTRTRPIDHAVGQVRGRLEIDIEVRGSGKKLVYGEIERLVGWVGSPRCAGVGCGDVDEEVFEAARLNKAGELGVGVDDLV